MKIKSSILDFPRKTLPPKLWVYEDNDGLPDLNPFLRDTIIREAKSELANFGLKLIASFLYGGAASYQWSEGTDIDVSLYLDWSQFKGDPLEIQKHFKDIEIPFEGHPVHLFVKSPGEEMIEVADAIYDVIKDRWVLPPLILPIGFDPEEYFKPFIKEAEKKATAFDKDIGDLVREWAVLKKAKGAQDNARDDKAVERRIHIQKKKIKKIAEDLAENFLEVRNKRYAMHDRLREKMAEDENIGRFERFQEPEIVWKYLDRAGYVDLLWKIYKTNKTGKLDKVLEMF